MTQGVYGKGAPYRDAFAPHWKVLMSDKPEVHRESSKEHMVWETVDPETWVLYGYVVIRVDARGSGRSPGKLDILSPREIKDYYNAIEWAGVQPWSTGKVGLNGISYYAITQWLVASLQPPHLAAMIPWEGAGDAYRDMMRHGGIQNNGFFDFWYPKQVVKVQHGNPQAWHDPWLGESSSGPESLSDAELQSNRADPISDVLSRPLDCEWYRSRSADWSKVTVPFLSAANWGGFGLHPRGNFEAFTRAASKQKWLECHPGRHEEWFYNDYGTALQKRFLDHFLKGADNGWDREPPVLLNLRRPFSNEFEMRKEADWPLPKTKWTKAYLDAADGFALPGMSWQPPSQWSKRSFAALGQPLTFLSPPLEKDTEITGPLAAKLFTSSSTTDMDLFLVFQAFLDGVEIDFQGVVEARIPLSYGWLRASHRKLDASKTLPYQPYHSHDEEQPLTPGETYELDVEIWPTNILLPKGAQIALQIGGKDFERLLPPLPSQPDAPWAMRPLNGCTHTNAEDRPSEVFGGETTIFTGGAKPSYILLPVIES
ncbi:hypothetical protein NEMBOFW57_008649 [Staphylotrichum longicolle]|uniref:Xaa-Pro dipeptidyl-peptidase C-terminal domain-containing protein n=1 Tax=Staphylotrichum longicolle TaxID=669026 RepID=A0AAD4ESE6_9PEZI|nr:hypothetical protein NEMBOFW57_008649 [Staphylotrichum longicolle]